MTEVTMETLAVKTTEMQIDTHQRHLRMIAKIKNYLGTYAAPGTSPEPAAPMGSLATLMLTDQPLSYWPFQQPAGSTSMPDVGSVGASLQLQGDRWDVDTTDYRLAPLALGKIAKATELSQGGWAYAQGAYTFQGGVTFEAWVSPPNWNWIQTIFCVMKSGSQVWALDHLNGTGFRINETVLGDVPLDGTKLHHLLVTVTATGVASLWWDGAQVGTSKQVAAPVSGDRVQIGKSPASGQIIGSAWTQVAVYGKTLSAEQIKARWAAGAGAAPRPQRGRYANVVPDPAKMFANQPITKLYNDPNRFVVATWWGGISTVEEAKAEKAAGSDAMIVITEWENPDHYRQAGLYAIPVIGSAKWTTGQQPNDTFRAATDVIAAWWSEDEMTLGLDDLNYGLNVLKADLDKADARFAVVANHGYDLAYRPPGDVSAILNIKGTNGRQHQSQGMDYYEHSTGPNIRKDMGQKLGLLPQDDAQALAQNEKMRHSYVHYLLCSYLRGLYDHDVMHKMFVGLGSANTSAGGGMPTGREVRGAWWAGIIAGAQCVDLFYHSFAEAPGFNDKRSYLKSERVIVVYGKDASDQDRFWTPAVEGTTAGKPPADGNTEWTSYPTPLFQWEAGRTYTRDQAVWRNGSAYTAVKTPTTGKAPENDLYVDATDTGAWVKWQYQAQGLRAIDKSSAPGMGAWVLKSKAESNKLARIIHTNAGDLALYDQRLIWRHWPNTAKHILAGDAKAYAWTAVMQGWDQWSGTYQVNIPAGITQVEVFTDLTGSPSTVPVVDGKAPVTFAKEYDVRWIRWAI